MILPRRSNRASITLLLLKVVNIKALILLTGFSPQVTFRQVNQPDDIEYFAGPGVFASPLPFSPAVRAGGFTFLSGIASVDEKGRVVHDTFENEARRTYQNITRILASAGLDFSRIVQVRCYLQRQEDWDAHNRIYREFFSPPYPARTTLVGCLGDLVKYEVDLIAYAGALRAGAEGS
jgi:2-iminobutanoate/2-iminopropanoate deaminase